MIFLFLLLRVWDNESEEAIASRPDFREETLFTVYPNWTEDFDDALYVKDVGGGKIEIGTHVIDATDFVEANLLVDREAKKRRGAEEMLLLAQEKLVTIRGFQKVTLLPYHDSETPYPSKAAYSFSCLKCPGL